MSFLQPTASTDGFFCGRDDGILAKSELQERKIMAAVKVELREQIARK